MQREVEKKIDLEMFSFIFRTKGLRNATNTPINVFNKIRVSFIFRTKGLRNATGAKFTHSQILDNFHIQNKGIKECN